jgi:hypothetical protein
MFILGRKIRGINYQCCDDHFDTRNLFLHHTSLVSICKLVENFEPYNTKLPTKVGI